MKSVFSFVVRVSEASLIGPSEPNSFLTQKRKAHYTWQVHKTSHFATNPSSEIRLIGIDTDLI